MSLALIGSDAGPGGAGPNQFSDQVCFVLRGSWMSFTDIERAVMRVFSLWDGALVLLGSLTSFL